MPFGAVHAYCHSGGIETKSRSARSEPNSCRSHTAHCIPVADIPLIITGLGMFSVDY